MSSRIFIQYFYPPENVYEEHNNGTVYWYKIIENGERNRQLKKIAVLGIPQEDNPGIQELLNGVYIKPFEGSRISEPKKSIISSLQQAYPDINSVSFLGELPFNSKGWNEDIGDSSLLDYRSI